MKKLFVLYFIIFGLIACNDPKEVKPIELTSGDVLAEYQLLVLNEGNFGNGVATISKIQWADSSGLRVEQNAFLNKNKEYLGNVVQSVSEIDGELWVVVNNSQKVVRCNLDLRKIGEINGLNSPRYLADNERYVFISDLYEKSLYVWSKAENKIVQKLKTNSWNEELVLFKNYLYVPQTDGRELLVLDATKLIWVDTIRLAREPFAQKINQKGELLVLCNGGLQEQEKAYLFYLDLQNNSKLDSLDLSHLEGMPSRLLVQNERVFVLAKHLYEIKGKQTKKLLDGSANSFYGLGAKNDFLFLSDAKDYVRNGMLHRYKLEDFSKHDSIEVGVIPGFIY